MNVEQAALLDREALEGGQLGAQDPRSFLSAGHFLSVEFPHPLPEIQHLAGIGNQGPTRSHYSR